MKLQSNQSKQLSFDMLIENAKTEPTAKFTFICENGIELSFPCALKDGKVEVNLPELNEHVNLLPNKEYEAFLEMVVDETYQKPWEGTVTIERPVSVRVRDLDEKTITKEKKVKATLVSEDDVSKPKQDELTKTVVKKDPVTKKKKPVKEKADLSTRFEDLLSKD